MKINKQQLEDKSFSGHMEAEEWFHKNYHDQFIMSGSGEVSGEKIYFYHLITNKECYKDGIQKLIDKGIVDGFEFVLSYYIVGIMEDGKVHVMY